LQHQISRIITPPIVIAGKEVEVLYAEDIFLRVEEVQKYLRIGRSSAYKLCNGRAFPVLRLGRLVLVKQSNLEAYLDNKEGEVKNAEKGRDA